jgi:hypothetical protein
MRGRNATLRRGHLRGLHVRRPLQRAHAELLSGESHLCLPATEQHKLYVNTVDSL